MKNLYRIFTGLFLISLFGCTPSSKYLDSAEQDAQNMPSVVLLHGLARSNIAMWRLASKLEDAGFHVIRVGYSSLTQTHDEILADISNQINACCAKHKRAVHFVGHSLGGLFVRAYLQDYKIENLGRVVLMGTPNQGTEIIDKYRDRWWVKILGPTALTLGTDEDSFPNSLNDPYYPVGVIAGVTNPGADDEISPEKGDGLISVESTKIKKGMTDFVIVETGHSAMRYNSEVAKQTIAFLKNGKFD